MNKIISWLMNPPTDGPKSTLLLRLMAGGVFFWEGLLKFVYANQGVGRFTKLGIPFPHFTATFIGGLEIVGGLLLLAGLTTRLIAIPFVAEMILAILSTKISLYLGNSPLPLPPAPPQVGFWAVLHEIRSEYGHDKVPLTILAIFDCEFFFVLRQLLRGEFGLRLRAVTLPIQRGIGPTNMEARHGNLQTSTSLRR